MVEQLEPSHAQWFGCLGQLRIGSEMAPIDVFASRSRKVLPRTVKTPPQLRSWQRICIFGPGTQISTSLIKDSLTYSILDADLTTIVSDVAEIRS